MPETSSFIGDVSFHKFLLFIFAIIFTFVLGTLLNVLIVKHLKGKAKPFVYKTISKAVMYSVYFFGLFFAFNKIINFNLPAGLAALGILGIAVLLPAVPVLQNLVAGIVLAIERPFREDDIIEYDRKLCKVKDIMLRRTVLRSLSGEIISIPNLVFMTSTPVINCSRGEFIMVSLDVNITPDSDKGKAVEIIERICNESPSILPNVPEKKQDVITRIFEVPRNFFKIPRNIKTLTPRVMVRDVSKDKISLQVWFWIWDITLRERVISSFYSKLMVEFRESKIRFG